MLKRLLALIVSVAMVLSLTSAFASAADEADAGESAPASSESAPASSESAEPAMSTEAQTEDPSEKPAVNVMADEIWAEDYQTNFEVKVNKKLKIKFYTNHKVNGVATVISWSNQNKDIVEIDSKNSNSGLGYIPKEGSEVQSYGYITVKGLKPGTAVIKMRVKKSMGEDKGTVYCETSITIRVTESGSESITISAAESSVKLNPKKEKTVLLSASASLEGKFISCESSNPGCATAALASGYADSEKKTKNLTIKGVKAGSCTITVTVRDKEGGTVLSTAKIDVTVTNPTVQISASTSSVNLTAGQEQKVLISSTAPLDLDAISYVNSNFSCAEADLASSYADSSRQSVYLTIKGLQAGSAVFTVTVKDKIGGTVLGTVTINVTVTGSGAFSIWPGESSVTLAANAQKSVLISASDTSFASLQWANSNSGCAEVHWGDWTGDTDSVGKHKACYMIIKGIKAGTTVVTITALDGNKNMLASTKINVTVPGSSSGSGSGSSSSGSNVITASNVTKNQSAKAQSFKLKASAKGGAALSYKSNTSSVKVDKSGKVTIAKNFCGVAKITITAAAKGNYKKTSKTVTVTVKPGKTSIKVGTATVKSFSSTWSKVPNVSGYQIKMDIGGMVKTFVNTKPSLKLDVSGFASKTAYKIQVRAYKTVSGKYIYGPWVTKNGKLK